MGKISIARYEKRASLWDMRTFDDKCIKSENVLVFSGFQIQPHKNFSFLCFSSYFPSNKLHQDTATSKTWARALDPNSNKRGPLKGWTLKNLTWRNLDPKKPEYWKTWSKYGIKKYAWF